MLQSFLSEIPELMARDSGFVRRESKLGGKELVQILTLGCLEDGKASLDRFAEVARDLGVEISSSGLHQRLTMEAVELMSQLCQLWMQQRAGDALREVLTPFAAVRIYDSSQIQLAPLLVERFRGTRNGAMLKVQLVYEYRSGRIDALAVEAGVVPDQNSNLSQTLSQAGDLSIFDLGYFDQQRFADLDAGGSYFVSRLRSQVALYGQPDDPSPMDLLAHLRRRTPSQPQGELLVYLGQKRKVPVRLIYARLSPDVVAERRRKVRQDAKKRGKTVSQRTLDWQDWSFFITNAPPHALALDQIATVYRLRWQIELLFKVWKQEMDWGFMAHWRVERVLSQFYGRTFALLIFHHLVEKYQAEHAWELCWPKAFRLLKRRFAKLIAIVRADFWGILTFLHDLDQAWRRSARKTKRRKDPSTYALLQLVRA